MRSPVKPHTSNPCENKHTVALRMHWSYLRFIANEAHRNQTIIRSSVCDFDCKVLLEDHSTHKRCSISYEIRSSLVRIRLLRYRCGNAKALTAKTSIVSFACAFSDVYSGHLLANNSAFVCFFTLRSHIVLKKAEKMDASCVYECTCGWGKKNRCSFVIWHVLPSS